MAIFISAGHYLKDSGAISGKYKENQLTIEFRDLVIGNLKASGASYIQDKDSETLSDYLRRIKPGNGSVVVEIHWNASSNPKATGTEVLIQDRHNQISRDLAQELSQGLSSIMKISNRGVKTESQSARGKLAFTHKEGACALIEMCFLSNPKDMESYERNKCILARYVADTLIKYDAKVV